MSASLPEAEAIVLPTDTATQPAIAASSRGTFEVWAKRTDGTARLYQSYRECDTAEAVAKRLREVGCPAEVRRAGARAR